VLKTE